MLSFTRGAFSLTLATASLEMEVYDTISVNHTIGLISCQSKIGLRQGMQECQFQVGTVSYLFLPISILSKLIWRMMQIKKLHLFETEFTTKLYSDIYFPSFPLPDLKSLFLVRATSSRRQKYRLKIRVFHISLLPSYGHPDYSVIKRFSH